MRGECRYSSTILDLSTWWRWVVSFTPRLLYTRGKSHQYPLNLISKQKYSSVIWGITCHCTLGSCSGSPKMYPRVELNASLFLPIAGSSFNPSDPCQPIQSACHWQRSSSHVYHYEHSDQKGQDFFLFPTVTRPALVPTQPTIQWVPGALSPGVKQQGHEADHSPPSSAEVKNGGAIPSLPHASSWHQSLGQLCLLPTFWTVNIMSGGNIMARGSCEGGWPSGPLSEASIRCCSVRTEAQEVDSSNNASDLYLGSARFESHQEHKPCWLRDFMVFLSSSRQILG
jgi:hypothetical protein